MGGKEVSDRRTVVLAGSYQQFRAWCLDNDRNPRDPSLIYASGMHRIRGLRDFDYVVYGTWYARRDALEIHSLLVCYQEMRDDNS